MQNSSERILTTHAGSLPRPPALRELLEQQSERESVDPAELAHLVTEATGGVIGHQVEAGVDVGNDGEQGRENFVTYVQHRLSGFGGRGPVRRFADMWEFPGYMEQMQARAGGARPGLRQPPEAVSEVSHVDLEPAQREVAEFLELSGAAQPGFRERFMTAPSPGIVGSAMHNAAYDRYEDYVFAVADALKPEYRAIADAGLLLQLDCPDLAMERHVLFHDRPLGEFLDFVDTNIAALNRAIEGIPSEQVRMHVCWGNSGSPHVFDVALREVLPHYFPARVGALLLPFANPRHAHEWKVLGELPIPDDWLLIAGMIDTTTNYVEHPELVADRLEAVASAVGDPTRVLAGTDCGFATAAGSNAVAHDVVWAKLRALRDGADLATERLGLAG